MEFSRVCTTATAKRRRKQARKNYMHMAPLKRPRFRRKSAERSAKDLARIRALLARGIKV
jgi:hypothetical protein